MMERTTPEQALCLHLLQQLAIGYTLPSEREVPLALIRDHLGSLGDERFGPLRAAAAQMLGAVTPLEWSFATMEAARALVPLHKAESCRLIAVLSVKRCA